MGTLCAEGELGPSPIVNGGSCVIYTLASPPARDNKETAEK